MCWLRMRPVQGQSIMVPVGGCPWPRFAFRQVLGFLYSLNIFRPRSICVGGGWLVGEIRGFLAFLSLFFATSGFISTKGVAGLIMLSFVLFLL